MNLYDAIIRAADHIERNPGEFNFGEPKVPTECGTPGCALGWIGYFAGTELRSYSSVCRKYFGMQEAGEFYTRLTELEGKLRVRGDYIDDWCSGTWPYKPEVCAKVLRLYAAKYHAPKLKRPTSALVADLMQKVLGERIAEEA